MKNIFGFNSWQLDKSVSNDLRYAGITIDLRYPPVKQFIEFKPKERIKKIDKYYKEKLKQLFSLYKFDEFELTGTKKRPTGIKAKVKFNNLEMLGKLEFISKINIDSIDYAIYVKTEVKPVDKYFCVKMTVLIDVEGLLPKKQSMEKRLVLIKAKSSDDAYAKLEKQKDNYSEPYLNTNGRLVRWRIGSFDDCYETLIDKPQDLNKPEGVEVYSKIKLRSMKTKTVWDSKF